MNVRSRLFVATTACLSLAASGCVIGPLDGDSVKKHNHDTFDFYGFADGPGDFVEIQARDSNGVWRYIDHTWSEDWYVDWNGTKLYYWGVNGVLLKNEPGKHLWQHLSGDPDFKHYCEVRVVGPGGYAMPTFDQNYPGPASAYSMTMGDVWALAGNGLSLTLYSED